MNILLILTILFFFLRIDATAEHPSLLYYETLHQKSLQHQLKKRDLSTDATIERKLNFMSHGRFFQLILHEDTSILTDDFKITLVNKSSKHSQDTMGLEFYQGYDVGEPDTSWVCAQWDETGLVSAAIHLENETFLIEPSFEHLPQSDNYTHISYRNSDMRMTDSKGHPLLGSGDIQWIPNKIEYGSSRSKRSTNCAEELGSKKTCPVLLVADYQFYKWRDISRGGETYRFLINQLYQINKLFQNQTFGSCGSGFGFRIKEIRVHTEFTSGYNSDFTHKNISQLLKSFSEEDHSDFCLAHLFTATHFKSCIWGIAYVGHPYRESGICGKFLNTGVTNYVDSNDRSLLPQQAMLITAHEFGHNWGSFHDSDECIPRDTEGGEYLMYENQGLGFDSNNQRFSNCSINGISNMLERKAKSCFIDESFNKCGNFYVDVGEECDEGPERNSDKCCDSKCKLKPNASCSDTNSLCCKNCQIANSSNICRLGDPGFCWNDTYCNGVNETCPKPENKLDGSQCRWGVCLNGTCSSLCSLYNKKHCTCQNAESSCNWCCIDNGVCSPLNDTLPEGAPCLNGICQNKVCVVKYADPLAWLWQIVQEIQDKRWSELMRANIVGFVMIISVSIWVPLSCLVCRIDDKRSMEENKNEKWNDKSNDKLVPANNMKNIRKSIRIHRVRVN